MTAPANDNRTELHRVVLCAEFGRTQQKPQNLRIGLGGPASHEVEQQEDQQSPKQTVEKVESGSAKTHGEEEEFSLGPKDREGPGQRPMHSVYAPSFRHVMFPSEIAWASATGK
jgi:hypothetical protein